MREGEFREDLYRRSRVFTLEIPPLRARVEDIPPLVQLCVQKLSRRLGRQIERVDSGHPGRADALLVAGQRA